jgi:PAS domain S-box-containing protein
MSITAILSEAILAAQSDAIVAADQDGIVRFWNPGAQRLFGYSSGEAIGKTLDLIVPERLRERHWDGYRRLMATGESRYGVADVLAVPALRKDGTTISVEFTVTLLQSEGRVIGIAAIMRDVSQRFEEMRALKRRLAELTKPAT